MGKHWVTALSKQILYWNSLLLWILKLIVSNLFNYITLVACHGFQDKSESDFLILVLCREQTWLVELLTFVILEGIDLKTDEVEVVELLLWEDDTWLTMVHAHNKPNWRECCNFTEYIKPLWVLELLDVHRVNQNVVIFEELVVCLSKLHLDIINLILDASNLALFLLNELTGKLL